MPRARLPGTPTFAMLILLALACTDPKTDAPIGVDDTGEPLPPPTDTFPSFYGEVPKNVLMVSMDTFRRDLMVRYGGVGYAPFLDERMAQGVSLDDHYSCSNWTFPSVMCVVEGVTNIEAGYVPDLRNPGEAQMPEDVPTMAGILSDAGWRTMLVTSNSWFSADHNSDFGFDSSERPTDRRTSAVFATGLERVQQARDEGIDRWFLHLHIKEPHPAYDPPEEYLAGLEGLPDVAYDFSDSDEQYDMHDEWPEMTPEEQEIVKEVLLVRYHGEVAYMNDQLTAAFVDLEQNGMLDDTLVVFWTDHGEQFWEHDEQTHAYGLNVEENAGVAFLWAKNIVPDSWDGPTSHVDLAPTVLSLLGVDDGNMTGIPVGTGEPDRVLDLASVARLGVVQAVVQDDWKLIYRWERGERQLYDMVNDPTEIDDQYDPEDPRAQALDALLAPQVEAMIPLATRHTPL